MSQLRRLLSSISAKKVNPNIVKDAKHNNNPSPIIPPKTTIEDVIDNIRTLFEIEDGDEIIIKEIYAETMQDDDLLKAHLR